MAKLTLTNPGSIANDQSFLTQLGNNNDLVEAAIENTLSRDGSSPNNMNAQLDMNSYPIINLPLPTTDTEPVRKGEFDELEDDFTTGMAELDAAVAAAQLAETNAELAETNAETAETNAEAAQAAAEAAALDAEGSAALAQAHIDDTTDAHDASAISNVPAGGVAATDVQSAINELDTDKLAASSYTAADVLSKLLTVDGVGSGLDADLLDGSSSAAFAAASHTHAISDVTNLQSSLDAKAPIANATHTGTFTTVGIDDNATGERIQIEDAVLNVGSSTSASEYWVIRPIADGLLGVGGDDAANEGANIRLYGATHATKAKDFDIRENTTTIVDWDSSAALLTLTNDQVQKGGFYIEERAADRPDTAGWGQFWVLNNTPNIPKFTDDAGNALTFAMLEKANTFTNSFTISKAGAAGNFILFEDTDTGAFSNIIRFYANSASPANGDRFGDLKWDFNSSTGVQRTGFEWYCIVTDTTNASEDARLEIYVIKNGTLTQEALIYNGWLLGAATGSDKGTGSINSTSGYFENGNLASAGFWVRATANSTTIQQSHNVASVADTATGRMTVNIATDFAANTWAGQVTLEVNNADAAVLVPSFDTGNIAAGSVIIEAWLVGTTTEALTDPTSWCVVGFGNR